MDISGFVLSSLHERAVNSKSAFHLFFRFEYLNSHEALYLPDIRNGNPTKTLLLIYSILFIIAI